MVDDLNIILPWAISSSPHFMKTIVWKRSAANCTGDILSDRWILSEIVIMDLSIYFLNQCSGSFKAIDISKLIFEVTKE